MASDDDDRIRQRLASRKPYSGWNVPYGIICGTSLGFIVWAVASNPEPFGVFMVSTYSAFAGFIVGMASVEYLVRRGLFPIGATDGDD